MKQALLILMMLLLPWQAATAAQRNLVHLLGGGAADITFVSKHIAEHEAHIFHHHDEHDDDDDDASPPTGAHQDDSSKSIQHLSDFEHGGTLNLLLQPPAPLLMETLPEMPPAFVSSAYSNRTTLPPLRPPSLPA